MEQWRNAAIPLFFSSFLVGCWIGSNIARRFGFAQRPRNITAQSVVRITWGFECRRNELSILPYLPVFILSTMLGGFMYILRCANGQYYTGSTRNLHRRLIQHYNGEGSNFTRKHLPVELLYYEEYDRIDKAFYREKQVQGWSRKKKEALMRGDFAGLHDLSICRNESHFRRFTLGNLKVLDELEGAGDVA